ncbi:uncharacterized protein [Antedon mediterranea]|uniref:uncharacterized protein n=1 Tax=Antedon mediterranea TaxID=105859 RepID=UPI003AF4EEBE
MNAAGLAEDDDPKPSICKNVLTFLERELNYLSEKNAHGVKVKMYIPCVCGSKGEHTHMHVIRKFDKDVLPCGSRGMEVKRYRNLFGDIVLKASESRDSTKQSIALDSDSDGHSNAQASTSILQRITASSSKEAGRQKNIDPESDTDDDDDDDDDDTVAKAHKMTKGKTSLKSKVKGSSKQRSMSDVKDYKDYVDDLTIDKVSREMDLSCRRFGVRLGLSWSKVNTIFDNENQTDKATAKMLKHWRSNIGSDLNQQQVLCTALRQHGRNDLADLLFHKYGDIAACFDDQDLLFICENVHQSWRRLAVRLGIKWDNVNNIADKNKHVEDAIMEVLVQWRNNCQHAEAHQLPTMIKALKQQGRVDLADSLCTRYEYKDDVSLEVAVFTDQSGQGCLTDLDFLIISEKMTDWKNFCRHLGIADVELSQTERRFSALTVEATMESLVQWRCKQGRDVKQQEEVVKALRAVERMDIVELLETKKEM